MKIIQRMKNELKALGYVDTRNYRYELDRHYDGSAYLSRIPMESVRRHSLAGAKLWVSRLVRKERCINA